MIKPIVLTTEGVTLELRDGDKRSEDSILIVKNQPIGRHKHCWGDIYFIAISESHHAITCHCNLHVRVPVPAMMACSYGDLRRFFEEFNSKPRLGQESDSSGISDGSMPPATTTTRGLSGYLVVPKTYPGAELT